MGSKEMVMVRRQRVKAVSALLLLSVSALSPLQPAFADDVPLPPDSSISVPPVLGPEPTTEAPVAPTQEPVPTEGPVPDPVGTAPVPAPGEPSGEPAAPPVVPAEGVPLPPAAVELPAAGQPAPAQTAPVGDPLTMPVPVESPVVEQTAEPSADGGQTIAAAVPSATPSVTPVQEEPDQGSPVQAVVSVATGSPLGVQLLTIAILLGAGILYFRALGSKGLRTPSRSAK